ncbi:MAG: peroxisome biogenesis factor 10 [Icmadophila ericetorum]|nr:peroxisome biogenesis factor 10 [Icmadophila ericetorum]
MKSPEGSVDSISALPNTSQQITSYQYPFASAADIIRANQKDIYFQEVLLEHITAILRKLFSARFVHTYSAEARTFADLLYLGCTTLIGNRTLGEEYCDIIQVEDDSFRLPSILRRGGYIISTVLLPFILNKITPMLRNTVRRRVEAAPGYPSKTSNASSGQGFRHYFADNILTMTSLSPLYALSLGIFYFTGSYYHIGKRLFGIRYIFTKRSSPSDQRIGYEVLGMLVVLQLIMQSWLHVRGVVQKGAQFTNNDTISVSDIPHSGAKTHIANVTQTPLHLDPRYDLTEAGPLGWIQGMQQRKCTLCLEAMKDPSVTTCGHVFCWTCITDWIKEKPECPLCRQAIMSQHVLPIRG